MPCHFLFICLFSAVPGLSCRMGFSLVVASRSYSLVAVHGLLIAMASPLAEHRLREPELSNWGTWTQQSGSPALEHRLNSCSFSNTGLVALQHVGSSQIRNPTHVSCIGKWMLYHWAIREASETVLCRRQCCINWFVVAMKLQWKPNRFLFCSMEIDKLLLELKWKSKAPRKDNPDKEQIDNLDKGEESYY